MKEHIWNDVLNKKSCIYHVENNKIKEKSSQKMRRCVQTFDWYCRHLQTQTYTWTSSLYVTGRIR